MLRSACALALAAALAFLPGRAPAAPAEHVVLVSIDGLAAYHLLNEELELPNIRRLIRDGAWAASSQTVFPSVTHPSHTTIVTGVEPRIHGVLSNSMTDRRTGEKFHPTNKRRADIVKVPTLFDLAKRKGLPTASFFWPETKDDPSIDFNIPEVFDAANKAERSAVPPAVLEELRRAGGAIDLYFDWYGGERQSAADLILAEAAAYAIRARKPALTAIHILVTDKNQHAHGPRHYLASAALSAADACVGILVRAVEQAGIAGSTTFAIVADHGFHSVAHELNVRPAFDAAGLAEKLDFGGGGWNLTLVRNAKFDRRKDQPKLEGVLRELLASPHIARIVRPDEMHALGQPRYEEDPHALGEYFVIPDIDTYLTAKPGGAMERIPKAPSHSHGYLPEHPRMYPALLFSGAGVRRGALLGHVHNADIAPTVARLLGLDAPAASGRVLTEALLD